MTEQIQRPFQLSVIIASLNGRPYIDDCLAALAQQKGDLATEVIVVDCVGPEVCGYIRTTYPHIQLLEQPVGRSVPALRATGILAARGELIAITEDHCIPTTTWFQSIIDAHEKVPYPAIGGSVDNAATKRIVDWAVYFCEYCQFASPIPPGTVQQLPGPNVSYKRFVLDEAVALIAAEGFNETAFHQHLVLQGHTLWSEPSLMVWHKKHFTLIAFLYERFHYGRWFAGNRGRAVKPAKKLFYLVFSPLLPFLLGARLARCVYRRKNYYWAFIQALPYLALFLCTWAVGECVGYAYGPGKSVYRLS